MRKIFHFSLVLFLIFSSCSKEEEITQVQIFGCTNPEMFNYYAEANTDDGTCTPFIYGCIDTTASNFNDLANTDDGSCLPSYYVLSQGVWNISPDCEDYTVPIIGTTISLNDQLPETIDVQGSSNNSIYIIINDSQINGDISSDGNIIIPQQVIVVDMGFAPMDINITGYGNISSTSNGILNLTYSFDIEVVPGFPVSESLDCLIILSR
jgi:hypothetical protein